MKEYIRELMKEARECDDVYYKSMVETAVHNAMAKMECKIIPK